MDGRVVDKKHKELKKMAASSATILAGAFVCAALFSVYTPEPVTIFANAETPEKAHAAENDIVSGSAVSTSPAIMEDINKDVIMPGQDSEEVSLATEPAVIVNDMNSTGSSIDPSVLSDTYIKIKKPEGAMEASITDNYLYKTVSLNITGVSDSAVKLSEVERHYGDKVYNGHTEKILLKPYLRAFLNGESKIDPAENEEYEKADRSLKKHKTNDPLIAYTVRANEDDSAELMLTLDTVYEPSLFEDDDYYYISLRKPHDIYDKVIVLDAGHGGKDPGSFSLDGEVAEKKVNLSIVNAMKKYFDKQSDIKVYYTRTTDTTTYLRSRADLANDLDADLFVSVHNNAYFTGDVYGSEVLYDEKDKSGRSKEIAGKLLTGMTEALGTKYRGLDAGSSIYVIHHTGMPSVLVETGYLTNNSDLSILQDKEKIDAVAERMCSIILDELRN